MTSVDLEGKTVVPAKPETIADEIVVSRHSGDESYLNLVWRRFRRSVAGMIGLVLVAMLLIMAVFADFFAPLDPKLTLLPYGPPTTLSFVDADGTFSFRPVYYPIVETGEFDCSGRAE